jgi:hypothetical protein
MRLPTFRATSHRERMQDTLISARLWMFIIVLQRGIVLDLFEFVHMHLPVHTSSNLILKSARTSSMELFKVDFNHMTHKIYSTTSKSSLLHFNAAASSSNAALAFYLSDNVLHMWLKSDKRGGGLTHLGRSPTSISISVASIINHSKGSNQGYSSVPVESYKARLIGLRRTLIFTKRHDGENTY